MTKCILVRTRTQALRCIFYCSLVFSIIIGCSSVSTAQSTQSAEDSCRNFVQEFYKWYLAKPSWPRALKDRPSAFSSELLKRLREDYEAQSSAQGDIAGLDFDPLLNSQDPAPQYVVGRINLKGEDTCWADIHAMFSGKRNEKPDVLAATVNQNGRWQFVNFYYSAPDGDFSPSVSRGGLLALLKRLREARRKVKAPSDLDKPGQSQNRVPAPNPKKPQGTPTPESNQQR
jgi:hypothetical protein